MAVVLTMAALADAAARNAACALHHGGNAAATNSTPARARRDKCCDDAPTRDEQRGRVQPGRPARALDVLPRYHVGRVSRPS